MKDPFLPPATPMWNYSVPYPLKQWIDTVVQPGINFSDSGQKLPGQGTRWLTQWLTGRTCSLRYHREGKERAVVVISSAGGVYKGEGSDPVQDFLNPYLRLQPHVQFTFNTYIDF